MLSTDIRLSGSAWLAGWRKDTGRLLVPMRVAPKQGERIALRIQLTDHPICATVIGSVAGVHQLGDQYRVELAPEAESLPAIRVLNGAAAGEQFEFAERHVRYLTRMPVLVNCNGSDSYTTTLSISEGGCALKWPNPLPAMDQPLRLRFRAGSRSFELSGTICWLQAGGSTGTVGVRFAPTTSSIAIANLLAEARRIGVVQE